MMYERITVDPNVMFGKPVVKGTRITIEQILRKLSAGLTIQQIIRDHPHLLPEDIYAATGYAADYMAHEDVVLAGEDA